jgi:hypothetical protein
LYLVKGTLRPHTTQMNARRLRISRKHVPGIPMWECPEATIFQQTRQTRTGPARSSKAV